MELVRDGQCEGEFISGQHVSIGCIKAKEQCEILQWGLSYGLYDGESSQFLREAFPLL